MHAKRVRFGAGSLGFGCRGGSGAVARAHGLYFDMEIGPWLGEEFSTGGLAVKLPTSYKLIFEMAAAAGSLTEGDVPADSSLDDAQLVYVTALFHGRLDEPCKNQTCSVRECSTAQRTHCKSPARIRIGEWPRRDLYI